MSGTEDLDPAIIATAELIDARVADTAALTAASGWRVQNWLGQPGNAAAERVAIARHHVTRCAPDVARGWDYDPATVKRPGSRVSPEPGDEITDRWLAEHDPIKPGRPMREGPRQANGQPSRKRADLIAATANHESVVRRAEMIGAARALIDELPVSRHEEYELNADSRFDLGIGGDREAPAGSMLGRLFLAGILDDELLSVAAELRRLWRAVLGGNGTGYAPAAALHGMVELWCRVDCGRAVSVSPDPTEPEPDPEDPLADDPTEAGYDPRADDPADDAEARLATARAMVEIMCPAGAWALLEGACTDCGTPAPAGGTLAWLVISLCLAGAALRLPEAVAASELRRMRAEAHRSYCATGLQDIHLIVAGGFRTAEFGPRTTSPPARHAPAGC